MKCYQGMKMKISVDFYNEMMYNRVNKNKEVYYG